MLCFVGSPRLSPQNIDEFVSWIKKVERNHVFFFKWRIAIKLPQCFCVFLLLPFIFYLQDSSIPEIQAVDCLRHKCIEILQTIQFSYLRFAPSNLLRFPRGLRHCAAWANSGECEAREQKFRIFS